MRNKALLCLSIVVLVLFASCTSKLPIETNVNGKVASFSFINQDEVRVSDETFEGRWWIADFIFTNCTTACLPMTANMAALQQALAEENLDVQLVSFSVDPEVDTPQVLKAYGEQYDADFSQWHFLTGGDFQTIKRLAVKSFQAFLQAPEGSSDQFTHDTRLFLVDPTGNIVKGYNGLESESVQLIIEDLRTLEKHRFIQSSN